MREPTVNARVTAAVVSHGQAALVAALLDDLVALRPPALARLVVVVNVPEAGAAGLAAAGDAAEDSVTSAGTIGVPGRERPQHIGLVDVVRVRDRRFVAVALGGKPELGDTLLIEAVGEFGAR